MEGTVEGSVELESKGVPPVEVVLEGPFRAVTKKPERARFEDYLQAEKGPVTLEPDNAKDYPHLVSQIQATLEQELFVWTKFSMQLPPTAITEAALDIVRVENVGNEIRQLAFGCEQAERPLLAVSRIWITMEPYLTLHITGTKNQPWTMRDCFISVNNEEFWAALKSAYGSFQVAAAKAAGHPASLVDLNLINPAEFNSSIEEGSSVEATIKTTRALKGAIKRLVNNGNPRFEVQFRVSTQEHASQQLLFTWPLKASDLMQVESPTLNLATPAMGERFTGPPPAVGGLVRKKLSPAQLSQIWQTRTLTVPSVQYPGTSHVWEISKMLASGAKQRQSDRDFLLARSFDQLCQTAWRFHNPISKGTTLCVSRGLHRMAHGFWNFLACTIGVPERGRMFSSQHIAHLLANEREYFLVTTLGLEFESDLEAAASVEEKEAVVKIHLPTSESANQLDEGTAAADTDKLLPASPPTGAVQRPAPRKQLQGLKFQNGLEIPFALEQYQSQIQERLGALLMEVNRRWRMDRMNFACEEEKKIRSSSSSGASSVTAEEGVKMSTLRAVLEAELERRILYAVREDKELASIHPRIPRALYRHLLAVRIVWKLCDAAEKKYIQDETTDNETRRKEHTILSQINWWNEWKNSKREPFDRLKAYQEALVQLNNADLVEYAAVLGCNLEFEQQRISYVKRLSAFVEPPIMYTYSARIWHPENWKIQRGPGKNPHYSAQKHTDFSVRGTTFGWRMIALLVRYRVYFNNVNYKLVRQLLHGPLSLRALLSWAEFTPGRTLDTTTGTLVPDPRSHQHTFCSRIRALCRHARASRASFEAKPDTGLLGKTVTRIFSRVWNWGILVGCGTLLVVLVQPVSCIVFTVLCAVVILCSPVWVLLITLLVWLWHCLFFDKKKYFERPKCSRFEKRDPYFPLFTALLGRFVSAGAGTCVLSLIGAVLHPVAALLLFFAAWARYLLSFLWDGFMHVALIRPLGKVPAEDGFLQRRIAGPGLSLGCFHQTSPEEALVVLQCQLEKLQLTYFSQFGEQLIQAPATHAHDVIQKMLGRFVKHPIPSDELLPRDNNVSQNRLKEFRKMVQMRRNMLDKLDSHSTLLRQSEVDAQRTLVRGSMLVSNFFTKSLLPHLTQQQEDQLWEKYDIQPGSWSELTQALLREAFHPHFTEPIGETDKLFRLNVSQVDLSGFLQMVESGSPQEPMADATPIVLGTLRNPEMPAATLSAKDALVDADAFVCVGRWEKPNAKGFKDLSDLREIHATLSENLQGTKATNKNNDQ